jgi:hypothetical protein
MRTTTTMTMGSSSPGGRTRRVSMKIKKGFKEVKELFSPHHHHHHHHSHEDDQQRQRRRKSGPNDTRRGPLAPVLDHLEKTKSVPIHLDISPARSFSVSRKGSSSSSYSCSDLALEESNTLADIHQHIQEQVDVQQQQRQQPPAPPAPESEPEPESEMTAPEPFPPSPLLPVDDDDDDEQAPNPFLVDDPEEPLSDLEPEPPTPSLVPAPPPPTAPSPLEASPSESIALSPPSSQLPLPSEEPASAVPLLNTDKPVPAPPPTSDTESEPEAPAVYLPQLVLPTMFLPIPNVRISSHLTWWLTRRTSSVYY